jgi:hypothetical protein
MKLTAEEWAEWREHPVTREYINMIDDVKQGELELISGSADFVSYARQDGRYMMMCDILDGIINLGKPQEGGN